MRLNQFIAHSGMCSRRKADELIKSGKIKINGEVIVSMGVVVNENDVVTCDDKELVPEKKVYVLLNKPKGYITSTADDMERQTVIDLIIPQIRKATKNDTLRIYPVGRLDRNTTGLLLITNDGELTQALSHPSFEVAKVYFATLDRPLDVDDYDKIAEGLELEDGKVTVDEVAYADPLERTKIGLALHSGRNRIVRRIFEHLGYDVVKLDRVMYASLTKKDLPRGKWRFLTEKEIIRLRYFSGKKMENIKVTKPPKKEPNARPGSGFKKRPPQNRGGERSFNTDRRHVSDNQGGAPMRERTYNKAPNPNYNANPEFKKPADPNTNQRPPRERKPSNFYKEKMNTPPDENGQNKEGFKKFTFNKPPKNPFEKRPERKDDRKDDK